MGTHHFGEMMMVTVVVMVMVMLVVMVTQVMVLLMVVNHGGDGDRQVAMTCYSGALWKCFR